MRAAALLGEMGSPPGARGAEEMELCLKRGRSRREELGPGGRVSGLRQEAGWAVRAGDRRGSFFASGTGVPRPQGPWPEPDGRPLRLPEGSEPAPWRPPGEMEAPLMAEGEAVSLLEALARELERELPGARLARAVLEDGASETEIASTRGVAATYRSRAASLFLEARAGSEGGTGICLNLAEREARRFQPSALARRLADRLVVEAEGTAPDRDRGEFVLGPPVAARLLGGLAPLFVGPRGASLASILRDRRGRIGSPAVTVIDDGRLPGGILEAPVDGEGVPTREVVLVEEGSFRQPLLAWWQAGAVRGRATGCSLRPGWRDLPRPGSTHLYLLPQPAVAPAALLGGIARGYYLIDATGEGDFAVEEDRFLLPVCGFAVRRGRATAPLAGAVLCGGIGAFLRGIQAVGRDLSFLPLGGFVGSPTLLVSGLELRADR